MLKTTIQAMTAGGADHPKVTTGTFSDLRALTVPITELVAKRPSPTYAHVVDAVRPIRDLVQRDMSGQKLANAKTKLPAYIDRKLTVDGTWNGPVWTFTIWLPKPLTETASGSGEYELDAGNLGFFMDAESRALAMEQRILTEPSADRRDQLLRMPVIIQVYDGIDPLRAAQHFRDMNGLGVGINASLSLGHDYDDPWMAVTRNVFAELGIPLEYQNRQVKSSGKEVLTVIAARTMVIAMVRGINAVSAGAGAVPPDIDGEPVDFIHLEQAAITWLGHVFGTLGVQSFKDRNLVLRAAPVIAALGALGEPFYAGDLDGQLAAKSTLHAGIDWTCGPRWQGVAGKLGPNGTFSVASGKETGYATFRALTDPESNDYRQVRAA